MIFTWQCAQCGWANDNNNGDCRRCGGNSEVKGRKEAITKKRDEAKIKVFDAARAAAKAAGNGT